MRKAITEAYRSKTVDTERCDCDAESSGPSPTHLQLSELNPLAAYRLAEFSDTNVQDCDAEQRENFTRAIFFYCVGMKLYPR